MNSGPVLAIGTSGEDVKRLQRILVMIKDLDYTGIDGLFGSNTASAVKSYQQGVPGLMVDGIAGPQTWSSLPADPDTSRLVVGASGSVVAALQKALASYSAEVPATNPGSIDRNFDPKTQAAVRAYQASRMIPVDGAVGDLTWWVPIGAAGATLASEAGLTT